MNRTRIGLIATLLVAGLACGPAAPTAATPSATSAPAKPGGPSNSPTVAPRPQAPAAGTAPVAGAASPSAGIQKPAAGGDAAAIKQQWDELAAKAKAEGEVVIFLGRAGSRQLRGAFPAFQDKYGVKVTAVAGSGNENADKVLAERDTGLYTADLWMGGLTTINTRLIPKQALAPIESQFLLPEVKDPAGWWKGTYWYGDAERKYTFLFAASPSPLLAYNTELFNPDELTSWKDLLDPRYKGKMVSRDPTSAGTGGNTAYFYFHPELGQDYLRQLFTRQDVTIVKDARQAADWLALGKYPIYLLNSGNDITQMASQGLPVKDFLKPLKEGARIAAGGTGSISLFDRAAHPNASKLFINWWLSKEGQAAMQKVNPEDQSLREDIPNDDVNPETRREPGVNYIFMDADPRVLGSEGEMIAFMKTVLAPR